MLEPILHSIVSQKKIVLASGSSRRKELLNNIVSSPFAIMISDFINIFLITFICEFNRLILFYRV